MIKYEHTDARRSILDFSHQEGIKSVKILTAGPDCVVGEHYHKNKDEFFVLLEGAGIAIVDDIKFELIIGDIVPCLRNTPHTFLFEEGSVLLGMTTELFDESDEHPL